MSSGEDFRKLALAFPHSVEKPHFDRTSFRVAVPKGKIFATMPADGLSANLMLSRDQQEILCHAEPGVFRPLPNKWGEKGATFVEIAAADLITLESTLAHAWRNAAPEKYWSLLG